jgi:hypothetical protein
MGMSNVAKVFRGFYGQGLSEKLLCEEGTICHSWEASEE